MPNKSRIGLLLVVSTIALPVVWVKAQSTPKLAAYYTTMPDVVVDARYTPLGITYAAHDLNGDGNQDLVVAGSNHPRGGGVCCDGQPGRVFLGDGNGHFTAAPAALFPVEKLSTVHCQSFVFSDFNADDRPDLFLGCIGWDASPGTGEQNRLYLSRPEGGWTDATDTLPQINDFTGHSSAGDISGRGVTDLFISNGYLRRLSAPYMLINTGTGQFTRASATIPAGRNDILDTDTGHPFGGSTLADLDGDGLPDLVVWADSRDNSTKLRHTTILWNRAGVFVNNDTTELPLPGIFTNTHMDLAVQAADVNQDGLPDLVVAGAQGNPYDDGWFVQILINKGSRQFADETATRVKPDEASEGIEGVATKTPFPYSLDVLDFNQDGAPDFFVRYSGNIATAPSARPLVWVNDGTGHFSALKVRDFVPDDRFSQSRILNALLVPTRNGYSFIEPLSFTGSGGLIITGMLATKPYRITPVPSGRRD